MTAEKIEQKKQNVFDGLVELTRLDEEACFLDLTSGVCHVLSIERIAEHAVSTTTFPARTKIVIGREMYSVRETIIEIKIAIKEAEKRTDANARLIAFAPDLLEMCQRLLSHAIEVPGASDRCKQAAALIGKVQGPKKITTKE